MLQCGYVFRSVLRFMISGLFCLVMLFAAGETEAETFVDQVGRSVDIPGPPERIVSLMPSITEIIFDLKAENLLKGVTLFTNEPPAAASLPKVGSYVHLDLEKIISLEPDLCLAARDGNPKHIIDRITALGIPVFTIDPKNLPQIMESIVMLGQVLQKEENALSIVQGMQDKIDHVSLRLEGSPSKPRVFFQIDAAPIISAGSETFIDHLISRAGGINLAAGATPYPRYSWEDILRMQPDIVIIASMAGGYSEDELKKSWRRWHQVPAVKNGKLFVVDAALFDRPTARLIDGLEMLVDILHPSL